jgi:hypothetical protein
VREVGSPQRGQAGLGHGFGGGGKGSSSGGTWRARKGRRTGPRYVFFPLSSRVKTSADVPLVHMITPHTSILRASHLILAVSSSRVFLPTQNSTYGMSPSPSLSYTTSTLSPSISALSLADPAPSSQHAGGTGTGTGLPDPPATRLSPHSVISISDILASVVRAYLPDDAAQTAQRQSQANWVGLGGTPPPEPVMGSAMSELRAVPSDQVGGVGIETWRWAKGVDLIDTHQSTEIPIK